MGAPDVGDAVDGAWVGEAVGADVGAAVVGSRVGDAVGSAVVGGSVHGTALICCVRHNKKHRFLYGNPVTASQTTSSRAEQIGHAARTKQISNPSNRAGLSCGDRQSARPDKAVPSVTCKVCVRLQLLGGDRRSEGQHPKNEAQRRHFVISMGAVNLR